MSQSRGRKTKYTLMRKALQLQREYLLDSMDEYCNRCGVTTDEEPPEALPHKEGCYLKLAFDAVCAALEEEP